MSKYFIAEFVQHHFEIWVSRFTSDGELRAILDPSNDLEPQLGKRYLVELIREVPSRFYRLVYIHDSTLDIFQDVQPLLLEATWQRPEHVTGEPWVEMTHEKYGSIKAKFFRPTGGRYVKKSFVEIQFSTEDGKWHSFTFEDGREVLLGDLEKCVHACVGPAVNLAAAISRQADSRTGRQNWRR